MPSDFELIAEITQADVEELEKAEQSYGDSWCRRGGVGAYMMLARKSDRIENQCKKDGYDIFKAILSNPGNDGLLDDIRDLRRYLLLVEAKHIIDNPPKEVAHHQV